MILRNHKTGGRGATLVSADIKKTNRDIGLE